METTGWFGVELTTLFGKASLLPESEEIPEEVNVLSCCEGHILSVFVVQQKTLFTSISWQCMLMV